MKQLGFGLFMLLSMGTWAQEKQSVYSIVEESHEEAWYVHQSALWKQDANSGSKDANAWYNYYMATRALRILSEQSKKPEYFELCRTISEELLKRFPKSFEANYVAAIEQGLGTGDNEYLWKAHKIAPNDKRLYDELLIQYEIKQQVKERNEMAKTMVATNDFASGILNWGHNLLSELDLNSIVFSAGDNDTYGLWLNQFGMGYREDVTVMNLYMMLLPDYRSQLFKKLGIPEMSQKDPTMEEVAEYVMKKSGSHDVYISASAFGCFESDSILKNMYLTGLAYKYSAETLDNLSLIRRNFEKRYALDYLTVQFSTHRMDAIAKRFNVFYIAPLVKLYCMYTDSEELSKQEEVAALLRSLIAGTEMQAEVEEILKN